MKETLGRDINGTVDYTLPLPGKCYDSPLSVNTIASTTTPSGYNRAFFSYAVGTNVWVTYDGSAPVIPASAGNSTQELNPAGRQIAITGGQTLKFISDTASFVNIRYDIGS